MNVADVRQRNGTCQGLHLADGVQILQRFKDHQSKLPSLLIPDASVSDSTSKYLHVKNKLLGIQGDSPSPSFLFHCNGHVLMV